MVLKERKKERKKKKRWRKSKKWEREQCQWQRRECGRTSAHVPPSCLGPSHDNRADSHGHVAVCGPPSKPPNRCVRSSSNRIRTASTNQPDKTLHSTCSAASSFTGGCAVVNRWSIADRRRNNWWGPRWYLLSVARGVCLLRCVVNKWIGGPLLGAFDAGCISVAPPSINYRFARRKAGSLAGFSGTLSPA